MERTRIALWLPALMVACVGDSVLGGEFLFGMPRFLTGGAYQNVLADMDQDGDLDNVIPRSVDGVVVQLNNGDGTFAPAVAYPVGGTPTFVAVGDMDGDGDLDVAAAEAYDSRVSVLRNDGLGGLTFVGAYSGVDAEALDIGDIDGDDDADLVVADLAGDSIAIYLNDGDMGFSAGTPIPGGDAPVRVELGDLDADGDLDLLVANEVSIRVLENDGFGVFAVNSVIEAGQPFELILCDFDGDGDLDAVATLASTSTDRLGVYLNDGAGNFAVTEYPGIGPMNDLTVGDIDGDGVLDAVACYNSSIIFRGNGDGTVKPSKPLNFGGIYKAGDIDLDGDTDLVSPAGVVVLNLGEGLFSPTVAHSAGKESAPPAIGDLDGDGDTDVVVSNTGGGGNVVRVLDNTWPAQPLQLFAEPVSYDVFPEAIQTEIADVTADGELDLVVLTQSADRLCVLQGVGDGTFAPFVSYQTQLLPESFALADLDGDGDLDAAVTNNFGVPTLSYHLNDGTGVFGASNVIDLPATVLHYVVAFDADQDGDNDLIAAGSGSTIRVIENDGDAGFSMAAVIPTVASPTSIAVGHADADGLLDLVVLGASGTSVMVMSGDGAGSFAEAGVHEYPGLTTAATLVDLDADGDNDLVVTVSGAGVAVHLNDGTGQFGEAQFYSGPLKASGIAAGDFDLDGDMDLGIQAFANQYGLNDFVVLSNLAHTSPPPPGADLNDDGYVDSIDLNIVLSSFGCAVDPGGTCPGDTDGSLTTDSVDLNAVLAAFGQ